MEHCKVKILDFGLARVKQHFTTEATQTSQVGNKGAGTPLYMAPEELSKIGYKAQPACDIWALGLVITELVTYKPAWGEGATDHQLLMSHFSKSLPLQVQALDEPLASTVCKCLSYEMKDRPNAIDMAKEIGTMFEEETFFGFKVFGLKA